jgi:hypothetical protein
MEEDNIFDEDDALDYTIYEELESEEKKSPNNTGCLGVVILLIMPSAIYFLSH